MHIVLKISKKDMEDISSHARKSYPHEACGILVGKREGHNRIVKRVYHTRNVLTSSSAYQIDPLEQLKIFEEAELEGLDVLGFYHSHPLQDSFWSRTDEERSKLWIGYSYLIVSLRASNVNVYVKRKKGVDKEEIVVLES